MRLANFLTANWRDAAEAQAKGEGLFGLREWLERTTYLFSPAFSFVACGTWSDPDFSPLPASVPIVNSGVEFTRVYDHFYWMYDACAYTAALAYVLNRRDWDLLVTLDNDVLVGDVDFQALLTEFMGRPETYLTPAWCRRPGGPFIALKREGAVRWQHMRRRANLIEEPTDPPPLLIEEELGAIFKGRWWNPWPEIATMRQDYGEDDPRPTREPLDQNWPFVRLPDPAIIGEYLATRTTLAKPVKP